MDFLYKFLSAETVYSLGIMLLHFMWQALVIAMALSVFMLLTRKSSPVPRYYAAIFSMFLLPIMAVFTFFRTRFSIDAVLATQNGYVSNINTISGNNSLIDRFIDLYATYLPLIVFIWFIGITALLLKNLGGLLYLQRIKNYYIEPVSDTIKDLVQQIGEKFLIRKMVQPLLSTKASTPMVIGHFKPVILIPKHVAENLSSEEIKIVLQHEMAHIKRNDFLVNLFQIMIEILFFFHPATWWISRIIRHEREECCDIYAAQSGEDKIILAKALTSIQEYKLKTPTMATTLINKKTGLYSRISNLFGNRPSTPSFHEGIIVTLFVFASFFIMSFVSIKNSEPKSERQSWNTISTKLSNGDYIYARVDSIGTLKELFVEGKKVRSKKFGYYQSKVDSIISDRNLVMGSDRTINKPVSDKKDEAMISHLKTNGINLDVDDNGKVNMTTDENGFKMHVNDGNSQVKMDFGKNGAYMDVTENGKTTFHMNIGANGVDIKAVNDEVQKEIEKGLKESKEDFENDAEEETEYSSSSENEDTYNHSAIFDKDSETRLIALDKTNDQETIKHVAIFDKDKNVRTLAVNKLKDQEGLKHVAIFDKDSEVRLIAVKKLKDQEGIKHVAIFDKDRDVRLVAVDELTDQSALKHVATFDKDPEVRKLALKRLK